jgi:xylulokinase
MALNSNGTSEVMFLPLQEPLSDPQLGRQGFEVGVHVDGEHYYTWGTVRTSGACVDWFRDQFARELGYAELIEASRQVQPGSMGVCFLPHLRSAVTPHFDEKALGAFAGLSTDVDRQTMFRAVLEGVAFEIHDALQTLLPYTGTPISTINAIGGGTRNELLMEIKASVLNTVIEVVDMEEAVALGAAMLGGLAAGVYVDVHDAMRSVQHSRTIFEPDPAQTIVYDSLFRDVYQQMYSALRPVSHAIYDFRERSIQR